MRNSFIWNSFLYHMKRIHLWSVNQLRNVRRVTATHLPRFLADARMARTALLIQRLNASVTRRLGRVLGMSMCLLPFLLVSFDMCVGLFWRTCKSLFTRGHGESNSAPQRLCHSPSWPSVRYLYHTCVNRDLRMSMCLLPFLLVSFDMCVGLFWRTCKSLLTHVWCVSPMCQQRFTSKETLVISEFSNVKRDPWYQSSLMSKETFSNFKRDLHVKRDSCDIRVLCYQSSLMSKETYVGLFAEYSKPT